MLWVEAKGVFSSDNANFQSFSVLIVLFRGLMTHSLENPTRNLRISSGLKRAKALNTLPISCAVKKSLFLWRECGDKGPCPRENSSCSEVLSLGFKFSPTQHIRSIHWDESTGRESINCVLIQNNMESLVLTPEL